MGMSFSYSPALSTPANHWYAEANRLLVELDAMEPVDRISRLQRLVDSDAVIPMLAIVPVWHALHPEVRD